MRRGTILSKSWVKSLGLALVAAFWAAGAPIGGAKAQAPASAPGLVQPWGLPPLPAGIGAVEKFADIGDTPQGKFLEGGAFDTDGNLWFVAIATGWISFLTPEGKLVPVFNCNPPDELGQTCEPQGTRWKDGKLYLTTRHRGILTYDPQTKDVKTLVYTYRNQLFKGPNDLDFDAEGNLYFTDPWATGPGPNMSDQTGAVYQYSKDGVLRKVMDGLNFPNGIAVSPDNNTLALGDCTAGRMIYGTFAGPTASTPGAPRDPLRLTFSSVRAGTYLPGRSSLRCQGEPLGGRAPARRPAADRSARPDHRFRANPERRSLDHQLRVRRPRQPDDLLDGCDNRHVLAVQGAPFRPDRPRRHAAGRAAVIEGDIAGRIGM